MGQLNLIVGAAGSGKTQRILDSIARRANESPFPTMEHPPLLIIVPEQQAMQTERAIYQRMAELSGRAAASARVNVMSFSRLANVLRTRAGQSYTPLGDLGRRLLVWQLLGKGGKAKAEVLANLIGELSQNGVEPGVLAGTALTQKDLGGTGGSPVNSGDAGVAPTGDGKGGDGAPPLQEKLAELSAVYGNFCNACTSRGLDFLDATCGIASLLSDEHWQYLPQTEVWIDGFLGFTAPEERAIAALLKQCKAVNATVLIDPAQTAQADYSAFADWFKPTRELYSWWKQTASELGVQCELERLTDLHRWSNATPLGSLAMCKGYTPTGTSANTVAEAVACGDDRSEVDYAARKIAGLVTTQGYSYNEISIITRDVSQYASLVKARFADHHIPTFIDERRKLESHPAVVLLLSGLKMALGLDQPGDAQALLKTELLPGAENTPEYRNQASLLEQAYVALGKRPQAWLAAADWDTSQAGLDGQRRAILAPVIALRNALQNLGEAEQTLHKTLGLAWEYLVPNRVASLLEQWAGQQEASNPVEAQIHRGVLNEIVKTLDALVKISSANVPVCEFSSANVPVCDISIDEALPPAELCSWLEFSFGQLSLGAPPPVLDSVLVTDIERGRHHPVKAVIMLGLAADTWPHQHKESPYLNDNERRALRNSAGRILGDNASDKAAKEPYFAMVAATRPSHLLVLTRPGSDSQGKAREPSVYYTHFCKFLGLTETTFSSRGDNASISTIASFNDLAVAAALQGGQSALSGLADELAQDNGGYPGISAISAARGWYQRKAKASTVDSSLSVAQMGTLLPGPPYSMSASRLENFADCPFTHFAHYYLGLKENTEPALDALALGSFYHEVLQRTVEALVRQGYDWVNGSIEEFRRVADSVLADANRQLHQTSGRERTALVEARAQVLLGLHAQVIAKSGVDSGCIPAGVEVAFGDREGDGLPAVRLQLSGGELLLRGKIDRIDIGADGSASVVDYKLSAKDVDWQLFLAGAQIQLPLYLMAVDGQRIDSQQSNQADVAMQASAASYCAIEVAWPKDEAILKSHQLLSKPTKKQAEAGDSSAAKIQAIMDKTAEIVSELGGRILAGEYAPFPLQQAGSGKHNACTFCSFAPLCRFDPLAGDVHRPTVAGKKADLYKEITEGGGHCGE